MRYDTIIIGGGLSGMTAAIAQAKQGKQVLMVANGENSLHFNGGSFDLLGYDAEGKTVENPVEAIKSLPTEHPYNKVGAENIQSLSVKAQKLLADAGIATTGSADRNHYRLTPLGLLKPTWLTSDGFVTSADSQKLPYKSVTLVNIEGFLDLPVALMADGLEKQGVAVTVETITTPALEQARRSPSEMRAANIALVLSKDEEVRRVADAINALNLTEDVILLPSVLGYKSDRQASSLQKLVTTKPLRYVATLPPSVTGIRTTYLLRRQLQNLGGIILANDEACAYDAEGNELKAIYTKKLESTRLEADNFILATGSFVSHGLQSNYEEVFEPVFHLDLNATGKHQDWTADSLFQPQAYMNYGVLTDNNFHAIKDGKAFSNLYAIGSLLSGNDQIALASAEGVDMLTALKVSEIIK